MESERELIFKLQFGPWVSFYSGIDSISSMLKNAAQKPIFDRWNG